MTDEQIKNYLEKYSINSEEQLAKHIEELKRNTTPNNEIIFPLVDMLINEKSVLNSFFAENKKIKNSMTYLDEVLENIVKKEQQIIKEWNCNSTNENTFIVFTTLEKELALDKDLHLSTRHKSEAGETHREGLEEIVNLVNSNKFKQYCDRTKELIKDICKNEGIPFHYENSAEKTEKKELAVDSVGKKESQTVEKAPIFTYCKVNKNALEALALRALHGHKKYEIGNDWENFIRVPNGDFEYSNSQFRHALEIGEDTEEEHLISASWNAVSRLEIYLRNKNK